MFFLNATLVISGCKGCTIVEAVVEAVEATVEAVLHCLFLGSEFSFHYTCIRFFIFI